MSEPLPQPPDTPPTASATDAAPVVVRDAPPTAPPGYEILYEAGEGGMGVVYRARDCELDRPVALKCLQPGLANHPSAVTRFLYEARVTARLQHPGIPPVHEVGALPDGRPFLAMKLINGHTLDKLVKDEGPGATRWLATFEAICQAVGYAHAEGVIHRDLKPSNVMVGSFGEVQVMDWGLAKVLPDRHVAATACQTEDSIPTRPPDPGIPGGDPTRAGSVLGTPAFMPPEQAIGAVERLDRRSDVFGLGAILCFLLTSKPPYVAPDPELTRQQAALAKLGEAFARLDASGAEPALIALAKRCLSADQEGRPKDAGELAQAVAELRRQAEERARQAELDKARAAVRAEEQRGRRHLTYLSVGVVMALLLGTGFVRGINVYLRDKERVEDARRAKDDLTRAEGRSREALAALGDVAALVQAQPHQPGTRRAAALRQARDRLGAMIDDAEGHNSDETLLWAALSLADLESLAGERRAAEKRVRDSTPLARRLVADADDARLRTELAALSRGRAASAKIGHDYGLAAAWFELGKGVSADSRGTLLAGRFKGAAFDWDDSIIDCQRNAEAVASLTFVRNQKPDVAAQLFGVRTRALLHRDDVSAAIATAEAWEVHGRSRPRDGYDAARAFALCAGKKKGDASLVTKAVAMLTRLRDADYFKDAGTRAELHNEADFAAVRDDPAFVKFADSLKP